MKNTETKLNAWRMSLEKNFPETKIGSTIKSVTDSIDSYSRKLQADKTLTPTARRLKEQRFKAKAYDKILKTADNRAQFLLSPLEHLNNKVSERLKTSGSMDALILLQTAATIKDMPVKDVFVMARNNLDVARAMLLNPVAQIKFNIAGDEKKRATLRGIIEDHVLSTDEQAQIATLREEIGQLAKVMDSSVDLHEEANNAVSYIESSMAKEPDLEPPEAA